MRYITASRGLSVLAKSVRPARIEANLNLIRLSQDELVNLAACIEKTQRYVYPEFGIDFGFPDKPMA